MRGDSSVGTTNVYRVNSVSPRKRGWSAICRDGIPEPRGLSACAEIVPAAIKADTRSTLTRTCGDSPDYEFLDQSALAVPLNTQGLSVSAPLSAEHGSRPVIVTSDAYLAHFLIEKLELSEGHASFWESRADMKVNSLDVRDAMKTQTLSPG